MKKMSLGTQTLLGMVAGGIVGFAVGPKIVAIQFVGDIFLRMLQMAIVPLIYVSVTTAIANMGDIKRLGRIGAKVVLLFLATSISASIFGVIIGRIGSPGKGLILRDLPPVTSLAESREGITGPWPRWLSPVITTPPVPCTTLGSICP